MSEIKNVEVRYKFICTTCPSSGAGNQLKEAFLRTLEEHLDRDVLHTIEITTSVVFR